MLLLAAAIVLVLIVLWVMWSKKSGFSVEPESTGWETGNTIALQTVKRLDNQPIVNKPVYEPFTDKHDDGSQRDERFMQMFSSRPAVQRAGVSGNAILLQHK
jgi:hypothetical protein